MRPVRRSAYHMLRRLVVLTLAAGLPVDAGGQVPAAGRAADILRIAGIGPGIIVHLGCGGGDLTTALHSSGSTVHGLDAEGANVEAARFYVRSNGVYGAVSIDTFDGQSLPYAANLVNLVVATDANCRVPGEEIVRVLAPRGVLVASPDAGIPGLQLVAEGKWMTYRKPVPNDTDEWTHESYDASGNPVGHDKVVGPPRLLQWVADPRHARSHEHTPSINAVVSSKGRIFYIVDDASTKDLRVSPEWRVVARDAYNGTLLWKRSVPAWYPHIVNWGQVPPELNRRMVALGDRVYVTLGIHAPLSILDAATGNTIRTCENTEGTEEVLFHRGVLLLVIRQTTNQRIKEWEAMIRLSRQERSPLFQRESADPIVSRFRSVENKTPKRVVALDAETGETLWQKAGAEHSPKPATLCADNGRVLYQTNRDTVCIDALTGRTIWAKPTPILQLVRGDHVVCGGNSVVSLLSAETGKEIWTKPPTLCSVRDTFVIGNSVWMGGFKPWEGRTTGKRGPAWGPYFATERDLMTGRILRQVEPEGPGHHHRCWDNKATDNYILGGRRGVEFIDVKTGAYLWHNWVRGVCKYGVMPCNGLLYAPPHACGCYIGAKLTGFNALAPAGGDRPVTTGTPRLHRGPAYGPTQGTAGQRPGWSTYRHDGARSGYTSESMPTALCRKWTAPVGGKITSPTVADGKLFVAAVDRHSVCAIDADSGQEAWRFTAGARVDSPPTIHNGRAVFGCRDGHVYSVRVSDGTMAWKLQTGRTERHVAILGQLESAAPVHGSVLVHAGVVYATSGRSSYLDDGISLCRIDPETGEMLSTTQILSPDPETGRQPAQYDPCSMPGALGDILTCDRQHVYLRDLVFDAKGKEQATGNPHLLTLTGFMDDTWPHRSYWIFGTRISMRTGCSGVDKDIIRGRLLVFDDTTVYGYGRSDVHWSNALRDGPYRMFAARRAGGIPVWSQTVSIEVRAILLARKVIYLAGVLKGSDKQQVRMVLLSAETGKELGDCRIESPPLFDGMAAAAGHIYISCEDGNVICMGEAE